MPGRKRGREDGEEDGELNRSGHTEDKLEAKRGRDDGESPRRPSSRASDKGEAIF